MRRWTDLSRNNRLNQQQTNRRISVPQRAVTIHLPDIHCHLRRHLRRPCHRHRTIEIWPTDIITIAAAINRILWMPLARIPQICNRKSHFVSMHCCRSQRSTVTSRLPQQSSQVKMKLYNNIQMTDGNMHRVPTMTSQGKLNNIVFTKCIYDSFHSNESPNPDFNFISNSDRNRLRLRCRVHQ